METEITGIQAMQLAKEISKIPDAFFTVAFFPYSRAKGEVSKELKIKERCKFRAQLPNEQFSIDSENFFLFLDSDGEPRMCYRILIRWMGFPHDNYKLHKVNWL